MFTSWRVESCNVKLFKYMRRSYKERNPHSRGAFATQGKIPDMVLVDQRPAEVETRLIAGNYEGDLIVGAVNRSAVGVLVERTPRHTMLCHLPLKRRHERAGGIHPPALADTPSPAPEPDLRPR